MGHRGAAAVAPQNTLEGLQAAIDSGADIVEFDIQSDLSLGHPGEERIGPRVLLHEAITFLAPAAIGIHLDLKAVGIEGAVVEALRAQGVMERTIISTPSIASHRALAALGGPVTAAITYPQDRLGASRFTWPKAVTAPAIAVGRAAMPARGRRLLRVSAAPAVALHHTLVTPRLVQVCHARDAGVIAWTVDDPLHVERLVRAGVDAIVSNDPQLVLTTLDTLWG